MRPTTTSPALPPAARRWPLLVIGASAGTATWSGWVGLGELVGFGIMHPLPGIADHFTINTTITLPIGVEAYAVYALSVATSTRVLDRRTRAYAWASSIAALVLGMAGQVAYHLMAAAGQERAPWQIVAVVSCLPVVVLGAASVLWHLTSHPATATATEDTTTTPVSIDLTDVAGDAETATTTPPDGSTEVASTDAVLVQPSPKRPRRRAATTRKAASTEASTAERVARVRAKHPDWSAPRIAEHLEISPRSARRYVNASDVLPASSDRDDLHPVDTPSLAASVATAQAA